MMMPGRFKGLRLAGGLGLMLAAVLANPAWAATLAGVTLPATVTAGHRVLVLNGIGLRTYSILRVHIYVAGLYLEQPDHDAQNILNSSGIKVLLLHFVHDVPAAKVRHAWRKGVIQNCQPPCVLPQAELAQFLAALPALHAGETVRLVFSPDGMRADYDGKPAGAVTDPYFARLLLAVFLGPHTTVPHLKAGLLGMRPLPRAAD